MDCSHSSHDETIGSLTSADTFSKNLELTVRIFYVTLCGIILASCSSTGGTSPVPASLPNGGAPSLAPHVHGDHVVYAFMGGTDAAIPQTALLAQNGDLYGTTPEGGTAGLGTVYKVSTSGSESVLYSFQGTLDGAYPGTSLVALNGTLYGTTSGGNTPSNGTVYSVDPSGNVSTIYTFTGSPDGSTPVGLTVLNGQLYGTTESGGVNGVGTVFKVSTSGSESVLYSFKGTPDASNPTAALVAVHGALYGTSFEGGAGAGFGTVFKVSTSGKEHVIYAFQANGSDGENPYASVITVEGKLYGTTQEGGTSGKGTVFEVSTSGKEQVLHSFTGGADGSTPLGGLIAVNGALYGPTAFGGVYGGACQQDPSGCGTIFKITTSGKKTTLYTFQGVPDGADPYATLIAVNKVLYGTTEGGGASNYGTVFKIKP
jgi:uncharacterized repeat protein (TIGR03803 family)